MSHELKVLTGILVVTVVAWVWANTLSPYSGELVGAAPVSLSAQAPSPAPADASNGVTGEEADEETVGEETVGEAEPGPAGVFPQAPSPAAPAQPQAAEELPAGARELRIATLPFIVTDDPVFEELAPADEGPLLRPQGARATVNPFAPIVVRPAPVTETPSPATVEPVTPTPAVVDVPIRLPDGTTAAPGPAPMLEAPAPPPPAPAPSAVTPAAPAVSRLPRAVPGTTLPAAPALMQYRRGAEAAPPAPQFDLSARVAVSLPGRDARGVAPAGRPPEPEATLAARVSEPTPLLEPRSAAAGAGAAPSSLRGYLLEHEVAYTGSVLGPVGVGIFRTSRGTVVVPLGQTLPQSDIVLTDLNGQWAELSMAGNRETLPIDSRR